MTPQERARVVVDAYEASEEFLPGVGHTYAVDLEQAISAAIREAVEEERAKCAMRVELTFVQARDTEFDLGFETARKVFAAAIRARSATPPSDTVEQ